MTSLSRIKIQELEAEKLRPVLEYFYKGKRSEHLDSVISSLFARFGTLHRILHAAPEELKAKSVLLAHNHPGGSCYPSREDNLSTTQMDDILYKIDVVLEDHIIIGEDGVYSILDGRKTDLDQLEIR